MGVAKKLKNVNAEAFAVGVYNFTTKNVEAKILAEERLLKNCLSCIHFVPETTDFFKVTDSEIPELTNMKCDVCDCVMAYKLRQSVKVCKLW